MYSTIANELLTKARVVWERAKEVHHEEIGMTKELPPILLVWGDGTFPATSRSGPIANDGLKDHLAPFFNECVWGIEYGTTKYSPCCKTPLLKKKKGAPKESNIKNESKWLPCSRQKAYRCGECHRPWSRDLAAARNIIEVELHYRIHHQIPDWAKGNFQPSVVARHQDCSGTFRPSSC
mmetsp:Transcript_42434/g.59454  ORF Transcript_42434/g.59454 Transcript_42434/m.59454 type:complete len:179 (-) Transcript_42434:68-604(-)